MEQGVLNRFDKAQPVPEWQKRWRSGEKNPEQLVVWGALGYQSNLLAVVFWLGHVDRQWDRFTCGHWSLITAVGGNRMNAGGSIQKHLVILTTQPKQSQTSNRRVLFVPNRGMFFTGHQPPDLNPPEHTFHLSKTRLKAKCHFFKAITAKRQSLNIWRFPSTNIQYM